MKPGKYIMKGKDQFGKRTQETIRVINYMGYEVQGGRGRGWVAWSPCGMKHPLFPDLIARNLKDIKNYIRQQKSGHAVLFKKDNRIFKGGIIKVLRK